MINQSNLDMDEKSILFLLKNSKVSRYKPLSNVFNPGDQATHLFYVVSGSLSIIAEEEDGRELVLGYVGPGDFVGEVGLFFDINVRGVYLRAKTLCEVAEIPHSKIKQILSDKNEYSSKILFGIGKQVSKRLLETTRKAVSISHLDVPGRILEALNDLKEDLSTIKSDDGFTVKISKQDISKIVGCSRETAGKSIKILHEKGIICSDGKHIKVINHRSST